MKNPLQRLLLVGWAVTDQQELIAADVAQWCERKYRTPGRTDRDLVELTSDPELRNIFYYRLRRGNRSGAIVAKLLWRLVPPVDQLDIATDEIGPGFYLSHGYGTIITAQRIGRNFWAHHGVSIGFDYSTAGRPVIGDDVFVGTGAVIIGGIEIGDRAVIGANAVVVRDVPAGATAIGVPAKIVGGDGGS